ncbi:MAG: hypothetical protein NUV34_05015 [Sulfuricaulis sp.]|nr:hypothetical protein [Sulfuricaulis sp.]
MTTLEALQAVYSKGEVCRECPHRFVEREAERLPGRRTEYTAWRGCDVLESVTPLAAAFAYEAYDCPGVEDELAKTEEKP